jgi:hypothetical protein
MSANTPQAFKNNSRISSGRHKSNNLLDSPMSAGPASPLTSINPRISKLQLNSVRPLLTRPPPTLPIPRQSHPLPHPPRRRHSRNLSLRSEIHQRGKTHGLKLAKQTQERNGSLKRGRQTLSGELKNGIFRSKSLNWQIQAQLAGHIYYVPQGKTYPLLLIVSIVETFARTSGLSHVEFPPPPSPCKPA